MRMNILQYNISLRDYGGDSILKLFVIDSGTTSSRVRLYDGERVVGSAVRPAGAKDVAIRGDASVVTDALRDCIAELLEAHSCALDEIDAIVASGMITSGVGLLEIPHREAPAGLDDIASALVARTFPDVADRPIYFIPGVKTGFGTDSDIAEKDMMRGEEAEIFGYLEGGEPDPEGGDLLFMHYGSHHKCILLRQGRIEGCRTSITGELMMTIMQQTILKSSLQSLSEFEPDEAWVRKGLETAEQAGFGRALFSVRVAETMEAAGKRRATSFYLGALLSLDFALLREMITPRTSRLVLYGKSLYPSVFEPIAKERYPELDVVAVSEEESDRLSARGAMRIFERYKVQ